MTYWRGRHQAITALWRDSF